VSVVLAEMGFFKSRSEQHRVAGHDFRRMSEELWTFKQLEYPKYTEEQALASLKQYKDRHASIRERSPNIPSLFQGKEDDVNIYVNFPSEFPK